MLEMQNILRLYGDEYRRVYGRNIAPGHYKALRHIEACRTAALGGHIDVCDRCGEKRISYNSCRNRHCPKCQFLKKEQWLDNRMADLLPVNYFHGVFTIPDILNPLCLNNQKTVYNILFRSVSETLKKLSGDTRYLNARIGFIAVLHTWGQNLMYHPHIHCIITGGGLSHDLKKWIPARSNFLFPVKVMAALFRGKFVAYLRESFNQDNIQHYTKKDFNALTNELYKKDWVVYSKPPFKNPETLLKYLASYTHRIAISNHRIVTCENGMVYFRWKDYADSNKKKIMALHAHEFIRRFLLHVLPAQFVRIRHYGLLGNRNRITYLQKCRSALQVSTEQHHKNVKSWQDKLLELTGVDISCCPCCGKGTMVYLQELHPVRCNSP